MHHTEGKILFRKCTIADVANAGSPDSRPQRLSATEFEIMSVEDMPDETLARYLR
jgi:hypothetical protein